MPVANAEPPMPADTVRPAAPPRTWFREFLSSAVEPSAPALAGALLVAGALLTSCILILTPDLLARVDCGAFMVNSEDEYAYLTSAVHHVMRADSSHKNLVLIGASALREAMADAGYLAGLMEQRLNEPYDVLQLCAAALTHWEAAGIADCIAENIRGIVVLEVSPLKMSFPPSLLERLVREPRLALDSEAYDYEIELAGFTAPNRTGNFFIDHYGFLSARPAALFNLVKGPAIPEFHQAKGWRAFTEEEWELALSELQRRIGRYPEFGPANLEVMGRIIARFRESGRVIVVLLESPRNPRALQIMRDSPQLSPILTMYERDVRAFANTWSVPYLNIAEEAGLTPSDFVDTSHIRNADAAKRYSEALISHLATIVDTPRAN